MVIKTRKLSSLSKTMNEVLLREIAQGYLLPLFSGAWIDEASDTSTPSESTVAYLNPQTIGFKVNRPDGYRLKFQRDQPFAKKEDPARELRVIEAFSEVLAEMNDELKGPLKDDLLSTFQRRVVARAVSERSEERQVLIILDQMSLWAARLYEGAPISSAIGIDPKSSGVKGATIEAFASNDFGAVLSNGFDSLLVFDNKLNFVEHHVLHPVGLLAKTCPWRQASIANWTANGHGRVAIVLNAQGEILVFRDRHLLFARRNGRWHFLTHSPILGQMVVPRDPKIREAVYQTVLDASFERTGACIGIVGSGSSQEWQSLISSLDRLELRVSDKSKALDAVVRGRKFHDLDRTLRQELVAIDGATLLNHKGELLAIGAVVRIRGGSEGGGRTAAAQALASLGLGIKISQDGSITGYRPKSSKSSTAEVAFRMM